MSMYCTKEQVYPTSLFQSWSAENTRVSSCPRRHILFQGPVCANICHYHAAFWSRPVRGGPLACTPGSTSFGPTQKPTAGDILAGPRRRRETVCFRLCADEGTVHP